MPLIQSQAAQAWWRHKALNFREMYWRFSWIIKLKLTYLVSVCIFLAAVAISARSARFNAPSRSVLYHFSYSTLLLGHDIERSELKLLQRPEDTRRNNVCKFKLYYSSKSPIHFFIIQAAWCHQAWAACDSVRLECILKCIDGFHVTSCHHTPEMDTALSY